MIIMKVIELQEHLNNLPPFDEIGLHISGKVRGQGRIINFDEVIMITPEELVTKNSNEDEILVKRLCRDCEESLFNEEVQLCKVGCERFQKTIPTDCTIFKGRVKK